MGTSAIPADLPIGVILFIIAYLAFCLRAELWYAKPPHEPKEERPNHDDKTPRV